ncbi:AUGMIN subunit 2-like isoform X2 [Argentina anserina]|uniref:AUGMIN subunit 2-like isoform X2 n=1 Tax=Argentina anserina TaxID=57926 RepID=UPI0021769392|nr:AUGMIN subunit 2-like isoform X2 [Potentilla anserina]
MSMGNESTWVGKKPLRRIGGMPDALSIASDLGFSVAAAPTPEVLQNWSSTGEKGDDLIRVLRELTTVQRKIADLQVELQGRKDDKNVSHLTHVSEMEMKCETLSRITTILNDVIQNKKQFSELLMKAASDYGALTTSFADFQWSQTFKEPPSVWGEMLRPIPVALASCTRFFEAMSAMRESFATLQQLRVGHSDTPQPITPAKDSRRVPGISDCVTPTPWKTEPSIDDLAIKSSSRLDIKHQEAEDESELDSSNHRRLSWPPSVKKVYLFNNQLSVWSPLQSVTVIFFKLVI